MPRAPVPLELRWNTRNSSGCSTANVFIIENDVRLIGFGLRQTIFMKSYLALKERYLQNSILEVSIR